MAKAPLANNYAASISFACFRVVGVISNPPSIRATSSTRLALSSEVTLLTVPPLPLPAFATWK